MPPTALFPTLELAFWTAAAVSIAVAVLWLLVVREKHFTGSGAMQAGETVPVGKALGTCLKSRNIWLAGISLMFLLGGATVISNFQVTALTGLKGYSEAFAGTFGTVLMIGFHYWFHFYPGSGRKAGTEGSGMLLLCGLIASACMVGIITLPAAGIYVTSFLNGALRSGIIAVMMSLPVMFPEIGAQICRHCRRTGRDPGAFGSGDYSHLYYCSPGRRKRVQLLLSGMRMHGDRQPHLLCYG